MRKSEIEAIGELTGAALAAGSSFIKEMHANIATRPFGALGVAAAPVRMIHDGVSRAVYTGVSRALSRAAGAGAALWAQGSRDAGPALAETVAGSIGLAAINGLYGDTIKRRGNRLALGMEVRHRGRTVALTPDGVAAAYPDASTRIAVFVHGLFETDESWRHFPLRGDRAGRRTYGELLHEDLGFTPIQIRYNTGLHVSDNGRELARLLDELLSAWPRHLDEIVLVGHSMGGLVARSACHYAAAEELRWTRAVRHVFCLGAPHLGADLEKGLNLLGWAASRLPETRAFGSVLNVRSAGIKDLRFGSCVEEDWCDCDVDEFLRDRCNEVPFLPEANYYFIAATLSNGPLGTLLGDLLVRIPSASGRGNGKGRRIPFEVDNGCEMTGLTHFDLLNHPAVYEQIRIWVTRQPVAALTR